MLLASSACYTLPPGSYMPHVLIVIVLFFFFEVFFFFFFSDVDHLKRKKIFAEFVTILFLFLCFVLVWLFSHEACGILAP